MANTLLLTSKEIEEIFQRHNKTIFRVCFSYLKNTADCEDVVQDTFCQLISHHPVFASDEHEKAWLIRTASNLCKNKLKHWWRKHEDLDDYQEFVAKPTNEEQGILELVFNLPEKLKTVVYLYYYEGYNSREVAQLLKKPESTIRNQLSEARQRLKEVLGESI